MKIYTKTGDSGSSSLLGGSRVSKSDPRLEAYGTLDELNAWMGLLKEQEALSSHRAFLGEIQEELFSMGSHLAAEDQAQVEAWITGNGQPAGRPVGSGDGPNGRWLRAIAQLYFVGWAPRLGNGPSGPYDLP